MIHLLDSATRCGSSLQGYDFLLVVMASDAPGYPNSQARLLVLRPKPLCTQNSLL